MCTNTIPAWKLGKKPNGKDIISFSPPKFNKRNFIHIPCGQCMDCRLEKSRIWAMRCMHEAELHENNCFITLTFNDEHVDPYYSLRKRDFQLFMKRLRKHLFSNGGQVKRVRFFHCGEYGEENHRPHHHAILFGYDFPGKKFKINRRDNNYFESETLAKLWSDPKTGESLGFHEITDVTFETCAYVARYVTKKVTGDKAKEHYVFMDEQGNFHKREPEYSTMSRRPGIGLGWYEKYKDTDVYAHDEVIIRGRVKCKPPRYYDNKYELTNPEEYEIIKVNRLKEAEENDDMSYDRQIVKQKVKEAQARFLKRQL